MGRDVKNSKHTFSKRYKQREYEQKEYEQRKYERGEPHAGNAPIWGHLQTGSTPMREKLQLAVLLTGAVILIGAAIVTQVSERKQHQNISEGKPGEEAVETGASGQLGECTVVIDAGHGGRDGGKESVDGETYEKEINLAIAYKLKDYLEENDINVIMTRETDDGLYKESDQNKKAADLRNRISLIEKAAPDIVVSIHQNSYPEESISGAQTFYYATSEQSRKLAELIQEQLIQGLDPDNTRKAKANDSYYLLKKTSVPIVIVECGFLSNRREAALLKTESYQDLAAWNIALGIMQFLNE